MTTIRERALFACINLRLDPRNARAMRSVAEALGAGLPASNAWVPASGAHILWQAHDEWLVMAADGEEERLGSLLRGALAGVHSAVTDVTDLLVAFELSGPRARDVLQKGCAVDLHPRAFAANACVQTALARVRVTLRALNAARDFEVLVERSFADYLSRWLTDAAAEYL
jgi:sarcosine oxidase, subunit gamma